MKTYTFTNVVPQTYNSMRSPWGDSDASTRVSFVCDLRGLPFDISLSANVRYPSMNKAVAKSIKATLERKEKRFWLMNAGWTVIASTCKYDRASNAVTVECGEGEGLTNGGHSALAERQYIEAGYACPNFTIVEVIVGIDNSDKAISLARNTSSKVSQGSLYSAQGLFDSLRQGLEGSPFADKISYIQNDRTISPGRKKLATVFWQTLLFPFLWQLPSSIRFGGLARCSCELSLARQTIGPEIDEFCRQEAARLCALSEQIQKEIPGVYDSMHGEGSFAFLIETQFYGKKSKFTFWGSEPLPVTVPILTVRAIYFALGNLTTWSKDLSSAYQDAVTMYELYKQKLVENAVEITGGLHFDSRGSANMKLVFYEGMKPISDRIWGLMEGRAR